MKPRIRGTVAAFATVLLLAGCAGAPDPFAGEQPDTSEISFGDIDHIVAESMRLQGTDAHGYDIYIAQSSELGDGSRCVVGVDLDGVAEFSFCSGGPGTLTGSFDGACIYKFYAAPTATPEGAGVMLSEWVSANC